MQQQGPDARSPQVVVIGSINMDMVARSARLPAPGETLVGEAFDMAPGGKGANQAVAAARLGARTAFVGRLGTRLHGAELLEALGREGVDCAGVVADPQALPGIAVIMVASEGGENSIVYVPGSNAMLSPQDVQAAVGLLQAARVVVAQLEVPLPAIARGFALARAAGVATVLNAAPALALEDTLLAQTDWLVLNETELAELAGAPVADMAQIALAAERLRARGAVRVLVTLGAKAPCFAMPLARSICRRGSSKRWIPWGPATPLSVAWSPAWRKAWRQRRPFSWAWRRPRLRSAAAACNPPCRGAAKLGA